MRCAAGSELDLYLMIGSSSCSKKNAKQINWSSISANDISASAVAKLSGLGAKKRGMNASELLKLASLSNELSFAGVSQQQAADSPNKTQGNIASSSEHHYA